LAPPLFSALPVGEEFSLEEFRVLPQEKLLF
jgi:hypothetical protein